MTSMLDNPKYGSNFGMELQGGADMLFKTKFKIKPKLILQDPIQYTQYSHNERESTTYRTTKGGNQI